MAKVRRLRAGSALEAAFQSFASARRAGVPSPLPWITAHELGEAKKHLKSSLPVAASPAASQFSSPGVQGASSEPSWVAVQATPTTWAVAVLAQSGMRAVVTQEEGEHIQHLSSAPGAGTVAVFTSSEVRIYTLTGHPTPCISMEHSERGDFTECAWETNNQLWVRGRASACCFTCAGGSWASLATTVWPSEPPNPDDQDVVSHPLLPLMQRSLSFSAEGLCCDIPPTHPCPGFPGLWWGRKGVFWAGAGLQPVWVWQLPHAQSQAPNRALQPPNPLAPLGQDALQCVAKAVVVGCAQPCLVAVAAGTVTLLQLHARESGPPLAVCLAALDLPALQADAPNNAVHTDGCDVLAEAVQLPSAVCLAEPTFDSPGRWLVGGVFLVHHGATITFLSITTSQQPEDPREESALSLGSADQLNVSFQSGEAWAVPAVHVPPPEPRAPSPAPPSTPVTAAGHSDTDVFALLHTYNIGTSGPGTRLEAMSNGMLAGRSTPPQLRLQASGPSRIGTQAGGTCKVYIGDYIARLQALPPREACTAQFNPLRAWQADSLDSDVGGQASVSIVAVTRQGTVLRLTASTSLQPQLIHEGGAQAHSFPESSEGVDLSRPRPGATHTPPVTPASLLQHAAQFRRVARGGGDDCGAVLRQAFGVLNDTSLWERGVRRFASVIAACSPRKRRSSKLSAPTSDIVDVHVQVGGGGASTGTVLSQVATWQRQVVAASDHRRFTRLGNSAGLSCLAMWASDSAGKRQAAEDPCAPYLLALAGSGAWPGLSSQSPVFTSAATALAVLAAKEADCLHQGGVSSTAMPWDVLPAPLRSALHDVLSHAPAQATCAVAAAFEWAARAAVCLPMSTRPKGGPSLQPPAPPPVQASASNGWLARASKLSAPIGHRLHSTPQNSAAAAALPRPVRRALRPAFQALAALRCAVQQAGDVVRHSSADGLAAVRCADSVLVAAPVADDPLQTAAAVSRVANAAMSCDLNTSTLSFVEEPTTPGACQPNDAFDAAIAAMDRSPAPDAGSVGNRSAGLAEASSALGGASSYDKESDAGLGSGGGEEAMKGAVEEDEAASGGPDALWPDAHSTASSLPATRGMREPGPLLQQVACTDGMPPSISAAWQKACSLPERLQRRVDAVVSAAHHATATQVQALEELCDIVESREKEVAGADAAWMQHHIDAVIGSVDWHSVAAACRVGLSPAVQVQVTAAILRAWCESARAVAPALLTLAGVNVPGLSDTLRSLLGVDAVPEISEEPESGLLRVAGELARLVVPGAPGSGMLDEYFSDTSSSGEEAAPPSHATPPPLRIVGQPSSDGPCVALSMRAVMDSHPSQGWAWSVLASRSTLARFVGGAALHGARGTVRAGDVGQLLNGSQADVVRPSLGLARLQWGVAGASLSVVTAGLASESLVATSQSDTRAAVPRTQGAPKHAVAGSAAPLNPTAVAWVRCAATVPLTLAALVARARVELGADLAAQLTPDRIVRQADTLALHCTCLVPGSPPSQAFAWVVQATDAPSWFAVWAEVSGSDLAARTPPWTLTGAGKRLPIVYTHALEAAVGLSVQGQVAREAHRRASLLQGLHDAPGSLAAAGEAAEAQDGQPQGGECDTSSAIEEPPAVSGVSVGSFKLARSPAATSVVHGALFTDPYLRRLWRPTSRLGKWNRYMRGWGGFPHPSRVWDSGTPELMQHVAALLQGDGPASKRPRVPEPLKAGTEREWRSAPLLVTAAPLTKDDVQDVLAGWLEGDE